MRACPTCKRKYAPGINFCPEDGTPLSERDPLLGTRLLGQFELRRVCGTGSMGTVYKAWQATMERAVAVKILRRDLQDDPTIVKRFQREARAAARLSHPNIITVYLVGATDDGRPFMVMEFVEGQSLEDLLREAGALPAVRAMHIGRQIASALAEAHGNDIIHRDLKPANILLTSKRTTPDFVKVLDFGIAKILYESDETQLTQTGAIFGTPYYISPEQASGGEIDARCDLYSLGVILFRMLTGRLPFESPSGMEVLIQHLKQEPPKLRDLVKSIPAPLEDLVLHAMAKEPSCRWRSAEDVVAALDTLGQELFGGTAPTPPPRVDRPGPAGAASDKRDQRDKRSARVEPRPTARPATDPELRVPHLVASASTRPAETPISSLAVHRAVEATLREQASQQPPALGHTDTDWLARRVGRRSRVAKHLLLAFLSLLVGSASGVVLHYRAAANLRRGLPQQETGPGATARARRTVNTTAQVAPVGARGAAARPDHGAPPDVPSTAPAAQGAGSQPTASQPTASQPTASLPPASLPPARRPKTRPRPRRAKRRPPVPAKKLVPAPAPVYPLPVPKIGEPATTGNGADPGSDHGDGSDHGTAKPAPKPVPKPAPKPVPKPVPVPEPPKKGDEPYDLVD